MRTFFAILSVAVLLVSCGTSPTVRYYSLVSMDFENNPPAQKNIGLGPFVFPEYLHRPQIVSRSEVTELHIAEYDRWAEPIESSFERVLAGNLDGLIKDYNVIDFPTATRLAELDYRVVGRVTRFDIDATNAAVLEVQWGFTNKSGKQVDTARRSHFASRVAQPDSYASMVAALNQTVEDFSHEIADVLHRAISSANTN